MAMNPETDERRHVALVPGVSGAGEFWQPVAERLPGDWRTTLLSWPGAGDQPHDPRIGGFEDLVAFTASKLPERSDVVAQSMGGVVAIGVALAHPSKVRRLVLVAASGGLDVTALGATDWREQYRAEFPNAAPWVWEQRPDYGDAIATVTAPTLLVWGDADPISPVAVGERLAEQLPRSALRVIRGGTHDVARERPGEIAELIVAHLA